MVSTIETNPTDFEDWHSLHRLLSDAFAYMAPRIDPPSSLTAMTQADVAHKARTEDLFVIRDPDPVACLFGTGQSPEIYYIGKLAVAQSHRNRGLARALINAAADHARARGHSQLELQTRVELTENHATFARLSFARTGTTSHPGFDRPTSLTFRRPL